jgi:ABC-type Fe3+ transport system substrate-binding protein
VSAIVDTNEPDVRALLTKIEAGELDAGITYVTDVGSSDGVDGVDIPVDVNVAATYPIVALVGAGDPDSANLFVAFVLSDRGRAILHDHGRLPMIADGDVSDQRRQGPRGARRHQLPVGCRSRLLAWIVVGARFCSAAM